MTYPKISEFFFAVLFFLLIQPDTVCQNKFSLDSLDVNEYDEEYYQADDSVDYVYPDYYRVTISQGYSQNDNMKLSSYSKQFYFNVSYCISNFPKPLEYIPTQVGLYSEIGLYNTSVFLNIGSELRIKRHLYLIPYAGIALIPFSKYGDEDMSFIYYIGVAAGYIINVNADVDFILEAATDFVKLQRNQNNNYFKIGVSYNLFYPL